ncbi:hypothetical protein ASZ90_006488 [hydrocarbon metagenome]|uniref:Glycosyltransferase RgtA/B/C/D-like domain-containing protein n=1 Tax=hydrocarbon metagenome TaxID=938273 RepID=A0A0W8FSB6_9ZZZZ
MKDKIRSGQLLPFLISCVIFIAASIFGWFKLQYGFNFTDEGWHMTEAWRLTAGDDFFLDHFTGAIKGVTLINYLIFKFYPGITLLGFRELQFFLTIASLLFLSFTLYKVSKEFWFQPIIFSLFAFTGLEPMGAISNLNYYTYPHMFITLYLAFFILGLRQQSFILKRILFITAGIFLWLISFSLLHMSLVVISVIILFVVIRKFKLESLDFTLNDLFFVLLPVVLLWMIFIGIYGKAYIQNIITTIHWLLNTSLYPAASLIYFDWNIFKYVIITLFFAITFLWSTRIAKTIPLTIFLLILAVMMFMTIDTDLFGLIKPYYHGYYNGWYSRPMWFAALLVSAYFLFIGYFVFKIVKKKSWSNLELVALVLFVSSVIMAINSSIFSALGFLAVLHSSIPAAAAMTCVILSLETVKKRIYFAQFAILVMFFAPFYYTTAWSDWKFTLFDVAPEQANAEIETGFGKGIKTNQIYKNLYEWISTTSQTYSGKDDYIISYVSSPMVHMIARRRPALDESFLFFMIVPENYLIASMEFMKNRGRNPKLVYVFEAMPALQPVTLKESMRLWQDKEISFPSDDAITRYVLDNMTLIDSFQIAEGLTVRCFLDNASASHVMGNKLKIKSGIENLDLLTD